MTASQSMPRPVADGDFDSRMLEKSELIDRMATEMRVKSGGELPLSFCIAQVKRQLAGIQPQSSAANNQATMPATSPVASVFHAWAIRE